MVFGNLSGRLGTGVCFTRDPSTGQAGVRRLPVERAEDNGRGDRGAHARGAERSTLRAHRELLRAMRRLETHRRDLCDIEFTIERGKWPTPADASRQAHRCGSVRIATQARRRAPHHDGRGARTDERRAGSRRRCSRSSTAAVTALTKAMAASPGAAVGEIMMDRRAIARAASGAHVILVQRETNPGRPRGHDRSQRCPHGARRPGTSHAAVVARGMGGAPGRRSRGPRCRRRLKVRVTRARCGRATSSRSTGPGARPFCSAGGQCCL